MIEVIKVEFSKEAMEPLFAIRDEVFVREQEVDPSIEYEFEEESQHFLATNNGSPVGTARWRRTKNGIKLERFAVLKNMRSKGVGSALVSAILKDISRSAEKGPLYLHSQVTACGLYAKHGFKPVGEQFLEADIWHYKMVYDPS